MRMFSCRNATSVGAVALLFSANVFAQTTVVSDNYNTTSAGAGFALNAGVNAGINPPSATRLTGTAATTLRYVQTATGKSTNAYAINNNRLRVAEDSGIGRFTLSANGLTPYSFASALGTSGATPADPAIYEVKISMRNDATGTQRFSFGIATTEGDVTTWDFGVQMYRTSATADAYTIARRIDSASSGVPDINATLGTTAPGSIGSLNLITIRITDAGAETTTFSSRVQVSLDNGATWAYDTSTDPALSSGWRFDAAGRVFVWDQAGNSGTTGGNVFYDNFSVVSIHAPPPPPERVWTGGGADDNWSTAANWGGVEPTGGEPLVFGLAARQVNFNDLGSLTPPTITFTNGGFTLNGNPVSIGSGVHHLAGNNTIGFPLDFPYTGIKNWQIAAGTELILSGASTLTTPGDHVIYGGGTLRLTGVLDIDQNPAFVISEGKFVLDGGAFSSMGGFRIGSQPTATAPVEVVISNSAQVSLELVGANLRVGDGAVGVPSRLIINNGNLHMVGGSLGIPFAAGCTGEVSQTGGVVKDCIVAFSDSGAGVGTYTIVNGILEPTQIRRDVAGGSAIMRFHNAFLRTSIAAVANFMSGLDVAEIQSGGLTLDASADVSIAQAFSGAGGLTKIGFSAITMEGANTYGGNTIVQEGRLILSNQHTNNAAVQVASGAEFGVLQNAAGKSLSAGSLGLGNSTLIFNLGTMGTPSAPLVRVSNLSATAGASSVAVKVSGGVGLTVGQFTLIDYSGAIGGSGYSGFTLLELPPGVVATLVNNVANSSIDLNVTSAPGLRWTGTNGTQWDYGTPNWFDDGTGAPGFYADGQATRFLDGASTGIVDLTSTFTPLLLVVSNNTLPYVMRDGNINVSQLVKSGSNVLTRVNGGFDIIPQITINGGTYNSSNTFDASFASELVDANGSGRFAKSGSATLTVTSASSTYKGRVEIVEGILKVGNGRALGATNGITVISNGATLDVNNQDLSHEPVIVSGSGVAGQGAIIDSTASGAVQVALTDVTMTGPTVLGAPGGGRWDIRVRSGNGAGPGLRGNGYNLTKVGPGFVSIACQRNLGAQTPYWEMNLGDILISEGTLAFAESLSLGNPSAGLTVSPGATLQVFDLGSTNPLLRTITMNAANLVSGGGASDTNVLNGSVVLSGANSIRLDEAQTIINGPISGAATLAVSASGVGALVLNGNNSFAGPTYVTNGIIGGNGVLGGHLLMQAGTLAPGWGVGTLTVNGNVVLAGETLMEINRGLLPNSDRLAVGGTLTAGGTLRVVVAAGANAPQAGDIYQLFTSPVGGVFSSVILPDLSALPGGLSWNTDSLYSSGSIKVIGSGTQPSINSVAVTNGQFVLVSSGGSAGASYSVLSSTNVVAPISEWITNSSGVFDATGSASNSIPVNPSEPQRFYRIKQP